MAHEEARYEYRAFAPSFGIVEQRLRAAGGAPSIRESNEVYLVSRMDEVHSVKIRDGQLDIKVLVNESHGLEQWDPRYKLDFPLSELTLAEVLAPSLGISSSLPAAAATSAEALVATLHTAVEGVVAVDLFKRRFGYLVEDCIAELAEVSFNGAAIRTVCVESTDARQVAQVAARLGLDVFANLSYLAAAKRIVGLVRTPVF